MTDTNGDGESTPMTMRTKGHTIRLERGSSVYVGRTEDGSGILVFEAKDGSRTAIGLSAEAMQALTNLLHPELTVRVSAWCLIEQGRAHHTAAPPPIPSTGSTPESERT